MAGREARRNNERLFYKFIVKYFENLHKDVYDEAMKLYEETKKYNPNVKDLTKTTQFMAVVTPDTPVPRYYTHRMLKSDITRQIQGGPRMVLNIPLHKQQQQPSQPLPVPPQPLPSTPTCIPSTTACISSPPPVPAQPAPLLMDDTTFQQLASELLKDPNLEQILNDFADYDDMNPYIQDDIFRMDDISPLETEMNLY